MGNINWFSLYSKKQSHWYTVQYLPSLSSIIIVAWPKLPTKTRGDVEGPIIRTNCSTSSKILSSSIETFNETSVTPAGNVTLNGPET